MRPGGALLALLASLLLLLLLRLLWSSTDAPARSRLWVEESREATHGTPAALKTLRSPATQPPRTMNSTYLNEKSLQPSERCKNLQAGLETLSNKTKKGHTEPGAGGTGTWGRRWRQHQRSRVASGLLASGATPIGQAALSSESRYSEDDYLQIITNIQSCPWKRQAEEYENFRAKLASCCDAVQNFIVSQNNTPVGTNMSYEVESKSEIQIRENVFAMLPVSQPFVEYPYNQCAVVGNGGILNQSLCGAEIDKSDFVFRCNIPPTTGNVSKDVGSKTNLVTLNPSIIRLRYGNLKEKKAMFLEDMATYGDAFVLLPAFSFRANTGASFKVYSTLKESKARQKVLFFHPKYLKNLALFWRTKGVTEYRLSSGLMITSVAVELCESVKLYGFWPFSKTAENTSVSHHYYDNHLPKRGFHEMPKEYSQILQLHVKGILKLQFSKCEVA
ncbi:alpha-2,8-sialyltransferase 8F isoform X1 [Camelus dromedarius]|uniref:alpha-2,8-sialyltransferase 8F isoform X1 n=1 Tax=Camelus dromedarius TaxID=9838 RepID=UPI003119CE58